jgi:tetratricopeptide (TPR) repeat protein
MLRHSGHAIRCFIALLWLSVSVLSLHAADAEVRAFTAAEKQFQDRFYEHAEKSFAEFVSKYPSSPRMGQALLRQAQAAREQGKFQVALSLLSTNIAAASANADEFQFQLGKTYDQSGRFAEAADAFAKLVSKFPDSALRLEAAVLEARARFNLKQWPRVVALLQDADSVFQKLAAAHPEQNTVVDGKLLLAEALLAQRDYAAAEGVLATIRVAALAGETRWRCEYLRTRAQFAGQRLETALASSSNVVAAGAAARDPALEAAGIALQGQILEALNEPEAAIAAYQKNQRPGVPAERVREALFKSVELTIAEGQITNAVLQLTNFLALHPNEVGSDVALVSVAELRLKEHQILMNRTNGLARSRSATNLLDEAVDNCERVLQRFTNSAFAGQAHLVRGWALFEQGSMAESLTAFRAAADMLPWSEAQAVARFKAADVAFRVGEVTNALRDFRRVLGEYASLRRVQEELVPRARYQVLQASITTGDRTAADTVGEAILREYPPNRFSERTFLLYGQALDELGDPVAARKAFAKFVERWPDSRLRPRMELAVARTYEREQAWARAIAKYDGWVTMFPTNENMPIAEYRRALANWQAGRETNAFVLFTNFVGRFATSSLAAYAEDWAGDFYFNHEQFASAERNYQIVYQNPSWKLRELIEIRYQALLKAGRSAVMRGNFNDATNYFAQLIEDRDSPEPVRMQAYFAYGDTYRDSISPLTNAVEKFSQALAIYSQIPRELARFNPNDPLLSRAFGEMANCYFQLGRDEPTNYIAAINYYQRVTNAASADVSARVQALVGIGNVQRKQAKLKQDSGAPAEASALLYAALSNYLKVLYDTYEGQKPDPVWLKEAALNAAEIAELRNEWDQALRVYQRIEDLLPALRVSLDKKIATARERAALKK